MESESKAAKMASYSPDPEFKTLLKNGDKNITFSWLDLKKVQSGASGSDEKKLKAEV